MSDHPGWEAVLALVRGELGPERTVALLEHLGHACPDCVEALLGDEPELTPVESAAYDEAIDRAFAAAHALHQRLERERSLVEQARPLIERGEVQALANLPRRVRGPALVEALLARSWALRFEDPTQMMQLALLAAKAAERLPSRVYGAAAVADLQCRAWADLGNAYRVCDRLDDAERAFDRALRLSEHGTGDRRLVIRLLELQASLAGDRRRFPLACSTLTVVYEHYLEEGDRHLAGRALIKKGLYTGYAGEPEAALGFLEQGHSLIDEAREPDLTAVAVHNRLLLLIDLGRLREARALLFKNRQRLEAAGGRVSRIKLRCLEARIAVGLGRLGQAEAIFREAKHGFEAVNQPYHASIASLEITAMLLRQRRVEEARELVLEAARVFSSLGIQREALGAVILLRQACEARAMTVMLVEEVVAFLKRIDHDPTARFEPRGL